MEYNRYMILMISEVYDALISAGASDDKARAAAKAVAEHRDDLSGVKLDMIEMKTEIRYLKWMMGLVIAMNAGIFGMVFELFTR